MVAARSLVSRLAAPRWRRSGAAALMLAALVVGAEHLRAQSLSLDAIPARAVARAGAGLLSDDLAGAWAHNPAAASRRTSPRVIIGACLIDGDLELSPYTDEPAPTMVSRAGVARTPLAAVAVSWGNTTFGVTFLSAQRVARRFEGPPAGTNTDDIQRAFSMRYAGLSGALRRELVMVGVSRRFGDELAVGVSAGAARIALRESRHLWGGLTPRDELADPRRDVEILTRGAKTGAPMASLGLVFVPNEGPVELGLAASYVAASTLTGSITGSATDARSPELVSDRIATLDLPAAWVLRSGARVQRGRWSTELSGQLELWPTAARSLRWQLPDSSLVDSSGAAAELRGLPSQLSLSSMASLRGALDYEAVDGLVWLVAGAAYSPVGTSAPRLAPGFGELSGVTVALGAEISAGGVTVAFGVSRLLAPARSVRQTLRSLDGPFAGGDAPTGFARYSGGTEIIGFSIEVEQL